MLPSPEDFGTAMEKLGVGKNDRIIVYDNSATRNAARGWFMLRHFGANSVAILDGGFQKWLAEDRPTESGLPSSRPASFDAIERPREVVIRREIAKGLGVPLVDARGRGRFEGTEPDPCPNVAAGHIPGSRNLPFSELYNPDGTFKSQTTSGICSSPPVPIPTSRSSPVAVRA